MKRKRPLKITSRVSSVTNGFVQSIIPDDEPCPHQESEVLAAFEMTADTMRCVYCGGSARHWDHLNPLVAKKRPSGFLNAAYNRVPACDECNTSKGGHPWRTWISGAAKGSPASRGTVDLQARIAKLDAFEQAYVVEAVDLEAIVGSEVWERYWSLRQSIEDRMFEAQKLAEIIRDKIAKELSS